jgi:hypothetical protein
MTRKREPARYRNLDNANRRIAQLMGICGWYNDELTEAKKVISAAWRCIEITNHTHLENRVQQLQAALDAYEARARRKP